VSVPVLSKTIVVILPAKFTLDGAIQKISLKRSRPTAQRTPTVIATGIAGETVIETRLKNL